jgi:hypothetical protein
MGVIVEQLRAPLPCAGDQPSPISKEDAQFVGIESQARIEPNGCKRSVDEGRGEEYGTYAHSKIRYTGGVPN